MSDPRQSRLLLPAPDNQRSAMQFQLTDFSRATLSLFPVDFIPQHTRALQTPQPMRLQ